jgi:hypothetical protein
MTEKEILKRKRLNSKSVIISDCTNVIINNLILNMPMFSIVVETVIVFVIKSNFTKFF